MTGVVVLNPVSIIDAYGNGPSFIRDDASGINKLLVESVVMDGSYGGQIEGLPQSSSPLPVYIAGTDGSLLHGILTDSNGRIITTTPSATASSGFSNGMATINTTNITPVRTSTYNEQNSNGTRSVKSSSGNDSSSGTGARTIKITYLAQDFTGPFYETLTMSGTTAVNTVSNNICYIEKMEVITAGSNLSNAGNISLYSSTGGTGTIIWLIATGNNKTFSCHHYVPYNKTCNITGILVGIKGSDSTGGFISARDLGTANAVDRQISEVIRVIANGQSFRSYTSPIVVSEKSIITGSVAPDSSSTRTYYMSFDFYEE